MDYVRISGNEPSSVILNQTKYFKEVEKRYSKVPKQSEAKYDGVINHKNTISINFIRKILLLSKRY